MKIKNILTALAVVALAGFTSCGDDEVSADGLFGTNTGGAYFSTDQSSQITLAKDASSFDVTVARTATEGAMTVSVTMDDPSGLFTAPSTVTFADGAATAPITVTYDPTKLQADLSYQLAFVLNDNVSPYGDGEYAISAVLPGDWTEWELLPLPGVYTYTGLMFNPGEDGPCPVYTRENLSNPNEMQYCFGNVGMPGVSADDEFGLMYGINMYVNVDLTDHDGVYYCTVPEIFTGVHNSTYDEDVMFCDTYTYTGNPGYQPKSYFDPKTGRFTLNVVYFISAGVFGNGDEFFQLGGYADYSMELSRRGNYVEGEKEYALVYAYMSPDLESFKYTAVKGDLSSSAIDAAAQALDADADADVKTSSSMLAFEFPEEGKYTVITVGYAEGEVKVVESIVCDFTTVQASNPWQSEGYVAYTDGYICSLYPLCVPEPYYVEVQSNKEDDGAYRLVNPYGEAFPYNEPGDYDANTNSYLYFNMADPAYVYVEESESTTDWGDGLFSFSSLVGMQLAGGYTVDDCKAAGVPAGTLANGVVTFPNKSLVVFYGSNGVYANNWISNYADVKENGAAPVYESPAAIDFNAAASAAEAKASMTKAAVRIAKANAKRSNAGLSLINANLRRAHKSAFNGHALNINNDVKSLRVSGSAL